MRILKSKFSIMMLVSVMFFSVVGSVYAQNQNTLDANGMTKEEVFVANLIMEHLKVDSSTGVFYLVNESQLKEDILNKAPNTSYEKIRNDIDQINSLIKEKQKDGPTVQPFSACSTALSLLGLFHGIQMNAAMLILGVATTPVLFAITAVTGAIWVGGSLLCP
ncbi:hypothetical protein [Paenibacillus sp. TC-CSREp1]|uniref:hypothetical protein n=1 Tax=Paenibacillus sp. TC-CSREp1 TaxID=3410089 RepID=UPI003D030C11